MKKLALVLTICAFSFFSNSVFAQPYGQAAKASTATAEKSFAWGIGLCGIAVIGVVAGLAAAGSTKSSTSH